MASVRGPAGFSGGISPQLSDEAARRKPARPRGALVLSAAGEAWAGCVRVGQVEGTGAGQAGHRCWRGAGPGGRGGSVEA